MQRQEIIRETGIQTEATIMQIFGATMRKRALKLVDGATQADLIVKKSKEQEVQTLDELLIKKKSSSPPTKRMTTF